MDEERLRKKLKNIFTDENGEEDLEREIHALVLEAEEMGIFSKDEVHVIKNVMEYRHQDAKDIMIHRKHIVGIDAKSTLEEAVQQILQTRYSRFPVYQETIDQIIGTIHIRDVLRLYVNSSNRSLPLEKIKGCIKAVSFIPETRAIQRLFKQMQMKKKHLAVVIDEYGQTAGIVTLEDIIEELLGNIQDEYDEEMEEIKKQPDGSYLALGIADLEDLEEVLQIPFSTLEYETLNGFLIDQLERIPGEEEEPIVVYEGYSFTVLSVDNNMISRVRIVKNSAE